MSDLQFRRFGYLRPKVYFRTRFKCIIHNLIFKFPDTINPFGFITMIELKEIPKVESGEVIQQE